MNGIGVWRGRCKVNKEEDKMGEVRGLAEGVWEWVREEDEEMDGS